MMQQTTLRSATYSMELSLKGLSSMLGLMNRHRASRIGQLLLKVGGAALGLVFALIATFRDLIATAYTADEDDDDKEGDLTGAYNFRTRKFDNGTDPYGWYEEDL